MPLCLLFCEVVIFVSAFAPASAPERVRCSRAPAERAAACAHGGSAACRENRDGALHIARTARAQLPELYIAVDLEAIDGKNTDRTLKTHTKDTTKTAHVSHLTLHDTAGHRLGRAAGSQK